MSVSLRKHLLNGGRTYGTMLMSNSPIIAEMMAGMGYGHVIIDHEHSPTDVASGQAMLQALRASNSITEPIVRVPSPDDLPYMRKVLDSLRLPGGIMVPMVDDVNTARRVVEGIRYARQVGDDYEGARGTRGCAVPFIRGSGWGSDPDYLRRCREDLLVIVQVETREGVESIPDIAAVGGIDMIFLGPLDLSCSIGKLGQFSDRAVVDFLADAEDRVKKSGKLLGGFRPPSRTAKEMFCDVGYSLVCGSVDLGLIVGAAKKDLADGRKWTT